MASAVKKGSEARGGAKKTVEDQKICIEEGKGALNYV
jgi:hypothetical protein